MSDHERHLCDACLTKEYEDFAHACVHESMAKSALWHEKYKIASWPTWEYSMEEATLTFSDGGKVRVICSMQVVGSTQSARWEWSWGNANVPEACRQAMPKVKAFGAEKQWLPLTTLFLDNDDYLGWEFASIAHHLLRGEGAYRCPGDNVDDYVYLVILSSQFVT